MAQKRIKEILRGIIKACNDELKYSEANGFIKNYVKLSNFLSVQSNNVLIVGRWYEFTNQTNGGIQMEATTANNRRTNTALIINGVVSMLTSALIDIAIDGRLDSKAQIIAGLRKAADSLEQSP